MKLNIKSITSLLALVLMAVSCTSNSNYLKVIPSDASLVVLVDSKSLIEKSNVADETELKDKLLSEAKSELSTATVTYGVLESFMEDPSSVGVDLSEPIGMFYTSNALKSANELPIIVVKMDDKSKLEETFDKIRMESDGTVSDVVANSLFSYVALANDEAILAYNDDVILFISKLRSEDSYRREIGNSIAFANKLFSEDNGESYIETNAYAEMKAMGGDMLMSISSESLLLGYDRYVVNMMKESGVYDYLIDMNQLYSFSFNDGEIVMEYVTYSENEKYNQLLETFSDSYDNLSEDVLNKFPKSTIALIAANFDGAEIYSTLKNETSILDLFADELNASQMKIMESLFNTLKGDMAIGLLDVDRRGNPTEFLSYMGVENENFITDLAAEIGVNITDVCRVEGENAYSIDNELYFGVVDNLFYATNSKSVGANIGEDFSESVLDMDLVLTPTDYVCYAMLGADNIMGKSFIQREIENSNLPIEIQNWINEFNTIEMGGNVDKTQIKFTFDNDVNPLEILVKGMSVMAE